ncbi:hypothetical protein [Gemmatimonas sp.]|uniref:hypothetical protein n=1 Tax=Gemmatimonas sp. TaxID=1962908 RepID=UPI003DA6C31B
MCGRSSRCEMRWCAGTGCWSLVEAAWQILRSKSPETAALRAWTEWTVQIAQRRGKRGKFRDAPRTIDVVGRWRRPLFRTDPTAPGPSRPSRAREQKAEHHLEDCSDHRYSCSGKPRNSVWGLDAGRRLHGQNFDWPGWSEGPRRREQPGAGFGATAADADRPRVVAGRQSLETERMNG